MSDAKITAETVRRICRDTLFPNDDDYQPLMAAADAMDHHDAVVRELVVVLEKAEMMMRMRGHLEMADQCAAALAKIAQEGKP